MIKSNFQVVTRKIKLVVLCHHFYGKISKTLLLKEDHLITFLNQKSNIYMFNSSSFITFLYVFAKLKTLPRKMVQLINLNHLSRLQCNVFFNTQHEQCGA